MGAVRGAARGAAAGAAAAGAAATGAGGGKLDGANTTGGPASGRAGVMPVSRLLRISASCQKASMTARGGRRGSAINDARHSINDVRRGSAINDR